MNTIKNDPTLMDRRSGLDRRSGNDRRRDDKLLLLKGDEQRSDFERRRLDEDRAGWVRVSKHSSTYLGLPLEEI